MKDYNKEDEKEKESKPAKPSGKVCFLFILERWGG
jgi:hypothetical protein